MHVLLLSIACLTAEPTTAVVVKSVEDAARLPKGVTHVRVVIPGQNDTAVLAAVLKNAPAIRKLELHHPANGVPAAMSLLLKFRMLEELQFTGDANLDDKGFATLGKLIWLKSLNMSLP